MKKSVSYTILIIVVLTIVLTSCNQFNISVDETEAVEEKSLIFDGPILIDNKPLLEMTYDDVIEHFGEPREIKIVKAVFPLDSYQYLSVLIYENIEIEFYTDKTNNSIPDKQRKVFRFDLTGSKYYLGELRVGMTVDEYLNKFGNSKMYTMFDVINFGSSNSEYEYVFYQQGITGDGYPIGLALLIKDNKIDRIVYGFPNAS